VGAEERKRKKEFAKAKTRRAIIRSKNLVKGSRERIARSKEAIESKRSRSRTELRDKSA
jgi:hypothetical protein